MDDEPPPPQPPTAVVHGGAVLVVELSQTPTDSHTNDLPSAAESSMHMTTKTSHLRSTKQCNSSLSMIITRLVHNNRVDITTGIITSLLANKTKLGVVFLFPTNLSALSRVSTVLAGWSLSNLIELLICDWVMMNCLLTNNRTPIGIGRLTLLLFPVESMRTSGICSRTRISGEATVQILVRHSILTTGHTLV